MQPFGSIHAPTNLGLSRYQDGRERRPDKLPQALVRRGLLESIGATEAASLAQYEKQPQLDGFWIHLDADVLDPSVMSAVDCPEPGGLTVDELTTLLARLVRSPRFVGMDVTVLDPELDPAGSSQRILVDILTEGLTTSREPTLL